MSKELAVQEENNFHLEHMDEKKRRLLKEVVCNGISDDDFEIFLMMCIRSRLDPFQKQIYAIPRGKKMTIQTSIDGFRLIAERTRKYVPGRESTYSYSNDGKLVSATSYVKKLASDGQWHEIGATAFYEEFCQKYEGKPSQFWAKMPHVMLAKCAEAAALRKAFPADLSGLYAAEEMEQAKNDIQDADCEVSTPKQNTKKIDFTVNQSQLSGNSGQFVDITPPKPKPEEPKISSEQVKVLQDLEPLLDEDCKKGIRLYMVEKKLNSFADLNQRQFNKFMKSFNENIAKQDVMPIEVSEEVSVGDAND